MMRDWNWALNRLREFERKPFLIHDDEAYAYTRLLETIHQWQREMRALGLQAGDVIGICGESCPQVIGLFLTVVFLNAIAVPLPPDLPVDRRDWFLSTARAKGVFIFGGDGSWRFHAVSAQPDRHPLIDQLRAQGEAGIIIFSSGTTGESKAALLVASRLMEKFRERPKKILKSLLFLKLDHIGGINTMLAMLMAGSTIISARQRTPVAVCQAIERHGVQLLPTTPTFLNMLILSSAHKSHNLRSLEMITYGTEPMPQSTLAAVNRFFPHVRCKQTYGLTELGIFSTKSRSNNSNWMKIGGEGIEVQVRGNTLWIRSRSAMLGYLNAPSPFDEQGWYNTEDQVEVDGDYYRILGRKQDLINVGGEKVYPAEVESVLLEMDNISEAVVVGKANPIMGQIVTATVSLDRPEDVRSLSRRVHVYCKERLVRYKIPSLISITDEKLVSSRFKKVRSVFWSRRSPQCQHNPTLNTERSGSRMSTTGSVRI